MLTIVLDKDLECTIVYVRCDSGLQQTLTLKLSAASPSPPTLPPPPPLPVVGRRPPLIDRTCSDQFFEENPSALISSGLLVQADEGVSLPVVDLIDESTAAYREEPVSLRFWLEPGACRQQDMLTWTDMITWSPAWTDMLTWSPTVLTVSVVKKRCIIRSTKQKMQSAVESIHQLQEISCCKQKSRPAVDTTDGSAGVAGPAGDLNEQLTRYTKKNQQLMSGTKKTISCWNELVEDETTAERTDNETAVAHQRRCISCCNEEKLLSDSDYMWSS
ncbi:F-box associated ubiquitination effector family protein [Dorcoceras hygrometricum]|uniref:F-box associated ubiquitination effector family protein n=1 Tax=Dorcoceras hygrometricum TaxID=472368 RepID=A0A2Z7D689_9LAMI|nr:F-box associated ubiquitination effector family protein [Dorcoceras hygrometricum]